jgi:hypothetical protein
MALSGVSIQFAARDELCRCTVQYTVPMSQPGSLSEAVVELGFCNSTLELGVVHTTVQCTVLT